MKMFYNLRAMLHTFEIKPMHFFFCMSVKHACSQPSLKQTPGLWNQMLPLWSDDTDVTIETVQSLETMTLSRP